MSSISPPPSSSSPSQPQSSPSIDPESQLDVAPQNHNQNQNHNQILLPWKNIVTFCFTAGLDITLMFAQTQSQLPISFHFISFGIFLTFLFLFVSTFISHKFPRPAQLMDKIASLLIATVVVLAFTFPFSLSIKCVIWALYVVSLISVLVSHYYCF